MQCKSAPFIHPVGRRVRCGRCLACKIKFRNDWASRIHFEMLHHWKHHGIVPVFITLTYRDNTLPRTPEGHATLQKKAFRMWINNTKKAIGSFRYYACGEYGKRATERAHYHLVLFPVHATQALAFCARWEKHFGFTSAYPLRDGGCNYVTKYATKFMEFEDRLKGAQEPEFRLSSRRPPLGQAFCLDLLEAVGRRGKDYWLNVVGDVPACVRSGGRIWPIAPFLRLKMRLKYDIPTTEVERIVRCPSHEKYCNYEEPVDCPEEYAAQTNKLIARARQVFHRSRVQSM